MANPRIFVGSTCYDLKYIRENLKYFIRTLGYEPVLSEEGSVFYDPSKHTHDSCILEITSCQLFVLIIGGRFGGKYKDTGKSITNTEYREAIKHKIPIFALVEHAVYAEHHVFLTNKQNSAIDERKIVYPAVDSTKIFDFIDEVRKNSLNNAIFPFRDFSEIESYLRQQWAGMMFSFLSTRNEENRVADIMSQFLSMNEKIEFLSNQILKSVGSKETQLLATLYDIMLDNESVKALLDTGHKPDPLTILRSQTLAECAENLGKPFEVLTDTNYITSSSGEIKTSHLVKMEKLYEKLRKRISEELDKAGVTMDRLL